MAHVVERTVGTGIPRTENLVLRQIQKSIARRVSVPEKEQLNALFGVLENQLFIEDQVGNFQIAVGNILASFLALAGLREFLRPVDAQQASAVRLRNHRGTGLGKNRVAI